MIKAMKCRIVISIVSIIIMTLYMLKNLPSEIQIFSDSYLYLNVSNWSIIEIVKSKNFIFPILLKVIGQDGFMYFQVILSILSWAIFGFVISLYMKTKTIIMATILFSLLIFLVINGWNFILLTESMYFSFFALWCSTFFLYVKKGKVIPLIVMSFIFFFTKENIPLFLVVCFAFLPILKMNRKKSFLLLLVISIVSICGYAYHPPEEISRAKIEFSTINSIFQRILPDDEKIEFFKDRGMPIDDAFILKWSKKWADENNFEIFTNDKYSEFLAWVRYHGRTTYAKYLLLHPRYTLKLVWENKGVLFTIVGYTRENKAINIVERFLFSFTVFIIMTIFMISYLLFIKMSPYRDRMYIFFLAIYFGLITNTIVIFHMDAMEISRHCILFPIGIGILFVLLGGILIDNVIYYLDIWKVYVKRIRFIDKIISKLD